MTTIAYDGSLLVSDSAMTVDSTMYPAAFRKIYTPEEGEYWDMNGVRILAFGHAGDVETIHLVKEELAKGLTYKTTIDAPNMSFSTLMIDENGLAHMWLFSSHKQQDSYTLLPMLPPVAVGSGSDFAMAVMTIGKSAKVAVKASIKLDINSDGNLQIFEFPGKPEKPSKRPEIETPTLPEVVTEKGTF